MHKLHFFVPVIGLSAIVMAFQAPSTSEYVSDTHELETRIQKCLDEVVDPANDMRCINASAAANHYWKIEMNAAASDVNAQYAAIKSMSNKCLTPRCTAAITQTRESKALEVAQQRYQTLQAAKPLSWTAS